MKAITDRHKSLRAKFHSFDIPAIPLGFQLVCEGHELGEERRENFRLLIQNILIRPYRYVYIRTQIHFHAAKFAEIHHAVWLRGRGPDFVPEVLFSNLGQVVGGA